MNRKKATKALTHQSLPQNNTAEKKAVKTLNVALKIFDCVIKGIIAFEKISDLITRVMEQITGCR